MKSRRHSAFKAKRDSLKQKLDTEKKKTWFQTKYSALKSMQKTSTKQKPQLARSQTLLGDNVVTDLD